MAPSYSTGGPGSRKTAAAPLSSRAPCLLFFGLSLCILRATVIRGCLAKGSDSLQPACKLPQQGNELERNSVCETCQKPSPEGQWAPLVNTLPLIFFFSPFALLRMEPTALNTLSKHSTSEPQPPPNASSGIASACHTLMGRCQFSEGRPLCQSCQARLAFCHEQHIPACAPCLQMRTDVTSLCPLKETQEPT